MMNDFLKNVLFVLWFFLPAGLANMAPIFAAHVSALKELDFPLDGKKTFRGKRVFGSHKTVRGLVCGILVGMATVYLQVFLFAHVSQIRTFVPLDYTSLCPWFLGLLASVGALGGDAVKSFLKRQMDIAPGKSWFPFDQIDYVLGGILLTALYIQLSIWQYLLLFIIWSLTHPLATSVGYVMKLKDNPM